MGLIVGILLIIGGALISTVVRKKINAQNIEIQYMKTTPIPELVKNLKDNEAQGLTGYREYAETKGVAVTESSHKTPYSGKEVAYYSASIYQVYEEMESYTDDKGNSHQRLVKKENLMSSEKSPGPIVIKDATTGEKVYADILEYGMQLDTLKTLDKFEAESAMQQYGFFKALSFTLMGARNLGFRMEEYSIPLNQSVYVLGEAFLEGGRVNFTKPTDAKKPYIVSAKSEADLVEGNKSSAAFALWGGIAMIIVGMVCPFLF